MPLLDIKNLNLAIDGNAILNDFNLTINQGETHAIMGPNGTGKSTLSYLLAGREGYDATSGDVKFKGKNLLELDVDERALMGLFLAFQYPQEIPGVSNNLFLRHAMNAKRKAAGEPEWDAMQFVKTLRETAKSIGMSDDMLKRSLNVGFSGGEKKRNEALQMLMLQPEMIILDETDSGLDIDALRLIGGAVNRLKEENRGILMITHYQRLLDHIKPDFVHIMVGGKIVKTGDYKLALTLEKEGYQEFEKQITASKRVA